MPVSKVYRRQLDLVLLLSGLSLLSIMIIIVHVYAIHKKNCRLGSKKTIRDNTGNTLVIFPCQVKYS